MSIAEKLTTIAENQQRVYDAGYAAGEANGSGGYDEGYSAGVKSEYDQFWDRVQGQGRRTNYGMSFCMAMFPRPAFDPKYDMHVTNAQYMFSYWNNDPATYGYFVLDLRDIGVELDFSQSTSFQSMFQGNYQVAAVGVIDTRSAAGLSNSFYYCIRLHTIEKLILKDDGSQTFSNTFTNCIALENLTVEGVIGNNMSFSYSKNLTHDSLMSVIGALKDFVEEGAGTTKTLTLGATNLAKLTEDEKQTARNKGWTLA